MRWKCESFADMKVSLLVSFSGRSHSIHTRSNTNKGLFRNDVIDRGEGGGCQIMTGDVPIDESEVEVFLFRN